MFEHHKIDNEPPSSSYSNSNYDEDESNDSSNQDDGRLPIQDHEHFEDPEFDRIWNATDEELDEIFESSNSDEDSEWEEV